MFGYYMNKEEALDLLVDEKVEQEKQDVLQDSVCSSVGRAEATHE